VIAASLAQLRQKKEAEAAVAEILDVDSVITISRFTKIHPVVRYRNLDGFLEGLRKAGLPA